jgi:hypothetical protein
VIIAKRICLPAQASWRDDFVKEFIDFPRGKFTDQVDATTQFLDHADEFAGLEAAPQPGLVATVNCAGQARISPSNGRSERGLSAAVSGNGQSINGSQRPHRF